MTSPFMLFLTMRGSPQCVLFVRFALFVSERFICPSSFLLYLAYDYCSSNIFCNLVLHLAVRRGCFFIFIVVVLCFEHWHSRVAYLCHEGLTIRNFVCARFFFLCCARAFTHLSCFQNKRFFHMLIFVAANHSL